MFVRVLPILASAVVLCCAFAQKPKKPIAAPPMKNSPEMEFKSFAQPFMKKYCTGCHTGKNAPDGVDLSKIVSVATAKKHVKMLKEGVEEMAHKKMPPQGSPQPNSQEKTRFTNWVKSLK